MKKNFVYLILLVSIVFSLNCFAAEEDEFFIGEYAYESASYKDAIVIFNRFLRLYPSSRYSSKVNFLIALSFYELNDFNSAVKSLKKITDDLDSAPAELKDLALFWLAKIHLKNRDFADAKKSMERFFKVFPESKLTNRAFLYLMESCFVSKDYIKAEKFFKDYAHRISDVNVMYKTYYKLLHYLYSSGMYLQLKEFINWIVVDYPYLESALSNFYLAQAHFYLDEYELAKETYEKTIPKIENKNLLNISRLNIGWILLSNQDYVGAKKYFSAIELLEDNNLKAKLLLGKSKLSFENSGFEDALILLNKVDVENIKDENLLIRFYFYRADTLFKLNQYRDALDDLLVLKNCYLNRMDSTTAESLFYLLADCYSRLGDTQSVISNLETLLCMVKDESKKIELLFKLGEIYESQSDYEKAVGLYNKVVAFGDRENDVLSAKERLGFASLAKGAYKEATEYFKQLKGTSFFTDKVKYHIAISYYNIGQVAESMDILNGLLGNTSSSLEKVKLQYLLGLNYLASKNYGPAQKNFSDITRLTNDKTMLIKAELGIVDCLSSNGEIEDAIRHLEKLRSKYPDSQMNAEILLRLADIYYFDNKLDMASRYIDNLLRFYPDYSDKGKALYLLANIYKDNKNYDEAGLFFKQARTYVKDKDLFLDITDNLSRLSLLQGDESSAVKVYEDFLLKFPQEIKAYIDIVRIYTDLNLQDKRSTFIDRSIASAEENFSKELIFYFAQFFEEIDSLEEAARHYQRLIKYNDQLGIKAKLRLAKILEYKNDLIRALAIYSQIVQMDIEESKFAKEMIKGLNLRISTQQ